jgi:hypothetical protein
MELDNYKVKNKSRRCRMLGESNRPGKFCIGKKQARQRTQYTAQVNMGFWSRLELIYRNFSGKIFQANPARSLNFNPFVPHSI